MRSKKCQEHRRRHSWCWWSWGSQRLQHREGLSLRKEGPPRRWSLPLLWVTVCFIWVFLHVSCVPVFFNLHLTFAQWFLTCPWSVRFASARTSSPRWSLRMSQAWSKPRRGLEHVTGRAIWSGIFTVFEFHCLFNFKIGFEVWFLMSCWYYFVLYVHLFSFLFNIHHGYVGLKSQNEKQNAAAKKESFMGWTMFDLSKIFQVNLQNFCHKTVGFW